MIKCLPNKILLSSLFFMLTITLNSQTKSNNIQTIDGKKYYIHKFEKGQSLYAVSKFYAANLDQLYLLNPELKNGVKAGQEIKIPYTGAESAIVSNTASVDAIDTLKYLRYKITKGETVYSISKK